MEKRIQELDVLRVLAMIFVITYHFWYEYATIGLPFVNLFYVTPNYDFGNVAVTIFIALSGGLLYKKYGAADTFDHISYKTFYVKRAKAIYPPFWIPCLYIPLTMLRHYFADGNAFFMGHPLKLLLTVAGFDGYVRAYGFDTYAFCGDWFVGAIVLLYLLFPLLAKCYRKFPVVTLLVLVVLYGFQYMIPAEHDDVFSILPVTISLKFCVGFFLIENLERFRNFRVALVAGILFLALSLINIPGRINTDCLGSVAAIALFAVVFYLSPRLLRFKAVSALVQKLAALSYCVFLVQHVTIGWTQMAYIRVFDKMHLVFSTWNVTALLALTFVAILLASWVLKRISDTIVKFFTFRTIL